MSLMSCFTASPHLPLLLKFSKYLMKKWQLRNKKMDKLAKEIILKQCTLYLNRKKCNFILLSTSNSKIINPPLSFVRSINSTNNYADVWKMRHLDWLVHVIIENMLYDMQKCLLIIVIPHWTPTSWKQFCIVICTSSYMMYPNIKCDHKK